MIGIRSATDQQQNISLYRQIWLPPYLALLLCMLAIPFAVIAENHGYYKKTGGLGVYFGILPAAMIQGHPSDHPESAMHDGIPDNRYSYHIMLAIFDTASGECIMNAVVEARVTPLGFAGVTRPLTPMNIAETITYGN